MALVWCGRNRSQDPRLEAAKPKGRGTSDASEKALEATMVTPKPKKKTKALVAKCIEIHSCWKISIQPFLIFLKMKMFRLRKDFACFSCFFFGFWNARRFRENWSLFWGSAGASKVGTQSGRRAGDHRFWRFPYHLFLAKLQDQCEKLKFPFLVRVSAGELTASVQVLWDVKLPVMFYLLLKTLWKESTVQRIA